MSDTVRVSAGIVRGEGRILAARRASGPQAGLWELPGGKVEEGESPLEALRREVREELGCELGVAWHYDTVEHDYPDFHLSMEVFACDLARGSEPSPAEGVHSELRWLSRDELADVEWLPADRGLVSGLASYWDQVLEDQML